MESPGLAMRRRLEKGIFRCERCVLPGVERHEVVGGQRKCCSVLSATKDFPSDIFRDVMCPTLGSVEGDHTDGVAILACQ